jgi:hypothetical protein
MDTPCDSVVLDSERAGNKWQVTVRFGGEAVFMDTLNPASASQREKFIKAVVAKLPQADSEVLDAELMKLAETTSTDDGPAGGPVEEADPEVRAEVDALLRSPDLLKTVLDDIAALGVAGERELKATVYLTGVSRLLHKPLAVIVQGPSSSGKSYVIEQVSRLFPPEAVIYATAMTPQALFHMKPGSLVHRFVVAGERSRLENDDRAEATRALREMLAGGRLSKLMPMKVGGSIETVLIEQDGPIAYAESTTMTQIFEEDANRCLIVNTDERQEQTERIIKTLAACYGGNGTDPAQKDALVRRHHHLQRRLEAAPVVIPFAELVGERFGVRRVEARRAYPQVMNMVQALALLHQHQRRRDVNGAIVADVEDYQVARCLLLKPLSRHVGGISDGARRFFDVLVQKVKTAEQFTSTQAKKMETSSKSSVYGWLSLLHEVGLLELVEQGKGPKPNIWRLTGAAISEVGDGADLLPAAAELAHCVYAGR